MKNEELAREWMDRAKSNLMISIPERIDDSIYLEDLCFNAQQCVEKAFKAFCIFNNIVFPRTHSIGYIIDIIIENNITIPNKIKKASRLTEYSVETRYPSDYDEIEYKEYLQVIKITKEVFEWVAKKINYNQL